MLAVDFSPCLMNSFCFLLLPLFWACPARAGSKAPGRVRVPGCFGTGFVLIWHGKLCLLCMFTYFSLSVRFPKVFSMWQRLQKPTEHNYSKGLSFHLTSSVVTYYPSLSKFNSLKLIFHFYTFPSQILTVSKALLFKDIPSLFYLF